MCVSACWYREERVFLPAGGKVECLAGTCYVCKGVEVPVLFSPSLKVEVEK